MKRYNICVKKIYQKNGEDKATWPSVGTLVHFPAYEDKKEGYKLELPIFGNTVFYVFEQVDKKAQAPVEKTIEYPVEEVNPNDVPY